jgi:hypothetical protein
MAIHLELDLHAEPLAICRFGPDEPTPAWVEAATGPLVGGRPAGPCRDQPRSRRPPGVPCGLRPRPPSRAVSDRSAAADVAAGSMT